MERDDDEIRAGDREDEDRFLEHHVAAFLLVAQPQVVEAGRHDEARTEHGCERQVLPEFGHEQGQARQRDRAQRHRDVVLDPRELLHSAQVAEKSGSGHHDHPQAQRPDLALAEQLGLEAEGDRYQHHAREEQEAAVAL